MRNAGKCDNGEGIEVCVLKFIAPSARDYWSSVQRMPYEMNDDGLFVEIEKPMPLIYRDIKLGYRLQTRFIRRKKSSCGNKSRGSF